ncbi:unnamed protein product [Adineta steineri]|uniref:Uncharacterized protein n=1 Tax=Adineta steineri TaxID=433720 RepID=A0A818YKG3_9BILA|nr:unnamed protein product [Adineta steineri]CAF1131331.1 unnamed protein product [Adineta steineri]CAF1133512.1 unnamed protein product [Adineta steineri]CAF3679037.1 unnamed protein product [Adineta steineri]CAF3754176.1 unnamed protein product [Adineta steineri]
MTHTIHRAVNHRDPLSYPRLENEETFTGRVAKQKVPFEQTETHVAQRDEPWNRLYSTATLTSGRHEIYTTDPKAPLDSLDFLLKTQYDQHGETFAGKARTCVQLETVSDDHGRVLKNRVVYKAPVQNDLNHPLRIAESGRKEHISEPKQAIQGNHTMLTNRGYARNHLGSYFVA